MQRLNVNRAILYTANVTALNSLLKRKHIFKSSTTIACAGIASYNYRNPTFYFSRNRSVIRTDNQYDNSGTTAT